MNNQKKQINQNDISTNLEVNQINVESTMTTNINQTENQDNVMLEIRSKLKSDKIIKNLKNDMLALLIIQLTIIIFFFYIKLVTTIELIFYIANCFFLLIGYMAAKNKKKYAGILGIVIGIFMILSFSIIDIILGIFLLIHSFKYNKVIKENNL